MSFIARATGKLPFAGRSLVENKAIEAISERDNPEEKKQKCLKSAAFLAIFAGLHGLQAKLGVADFTHDTKDISSDPSLLDAVEVGISGLYTLANTMVTYTQLEIAGRVGKNYLRFKRSVDNGEYQPRPDYIVKAQNPMVQEVVFTSIGQMVFLSMFDR